MSETECFHAKSHRNKLSNGHIIVTTHKNTSEQHVWGPIRQHVFPSKCAEDSPEPQTHGGHHATGTNGSPSACAAVTTCAVCRYMRLWEACSWWSSGASLWGKDACSHHAKHRNSKLSPPVGCWFWVVPRSMLLEALTCWNCRWFWVWAGDWGWARQEFSLEEKKKKKSNQQSQ